MSKKQCSKCKKWRDKSEFFNDKSKKDGLRSSCKICGKEYNEQNKDRKRDYNKKYYADNKDFLSKKSKKYYESYYVNNINKIKEYSILYYSNNKDKINETNKNWMCSLSLYDTYKNKLTIDEDPRLAKDGVSLEVKCRYCGKHFIPKNSTISHRIQSLNGKMAGEMGLYCSGGCKEACPIYNQTTWPKGFKKATSREVQPQLRQMVLARDNYECQHCQNGIDDVQLHCHHIWPLNESPITSADMDECITLCIDCHKKIHKEVDGCGYYEMRCS